MSRHVLDASLAASRKLRGRGWVRICFPNGWNPNEIFDWYHQQDSTEIDTLQLYREYEEPFRHQFLIVTVRRSPWVYRFERRQTPTQGSPLDALTSGGTPAFDTVEAFPSRSESPYNAPAECLAELKFKCSVDLKFILAICFGIQRDEAAQNYTLQRFNCYFFAWSITACLARYAESYEAPSPDTLFRVLSLAEERHSACPPETIRWLRTESPMLRGRIQAVLRRILWWDSLKDELQSMLQEVAREHTLAKARKDAKEAAAGAAWLSANAASASALTHASRYAEAGPESSAPPVWAKAWLMAWSRSWGTAWDSAWDSVQPIEWVTAFDSTWSMVWRRTKSVAWENSWEMAWEAMCGARSSRSRRSHESDAKSAALAELENTERHAARDNARDVARKAIQSAVGDAISVSNVVAGPIAQATQECQSHHQSGCSITLIKERTGLFTKLKFSKSESPQQIRLDITNVQFQKFLTDLGKEHSARVERLSLGTYESVLQDIREAMGRVWRVALDANEGETPPPRENWLVEAGHMIMGRTTNLNFRLNTYH